MKCLGKILGVALVLGGVCTTAAQVQACGGYMPLDPLVLSALSENSATAQKARQELRQLGNAGIQRVLLHQSGVSLQLRLIERYIESTETRLPNEQAKMNQQQLDQTLRVLEELRQTRTNLLRDQVRVQELLSELRIHHAATVARLVLQQAGQF